MIFRATGRKRSGSDCPRSSTPPAKYAAVCCSGPSPKNASAAAASAIFAARIQQHLSRCGVSLRDLVWQTDNGGEFKGDFPNALGDSQHVLIPPAAHAYQSDVETVHRLEEDEFFDLEQFSSRGDFLAKVHTYQALLQPRAPQLPQRKSKKSLANHRAARSPLLNQTLLTPARLARLPPQRHRGIR